MRFLVVLLLAITAAGQAATENPNVPFEQSTSSRTNADLVAHNGESVPPPKGRKPETEVGPMPIGIHPYLEPEFTIAGGYSPGFASSGGVDFEQVRYFMLATANYAFVRKNNDGAQVPNEHGHTRGLEGQAFWRLGSSFVGGGAQWGETAVTPYRKYSWAPEISAGHDFRPEVRILGSYFRSLREYTDYPGIVQFTPGPGQPAYSRYCICGNGVSGVGLQVWFAPQARGHMIFHYDANVIHFHQTVTDPYDVPLSASESAQKSFSGEITYGVQFRY